MIRLNKQDKTVWLQVSNLSQQVQSSLTKNGWSTSTDEEVHDHANNILFYVQSDTLVNSILPLLKLSNHYFVCVPKHQDEGAKQELRNHNIKFYQFENDLLRKFKIDIIVLLNDWDLSARRLITLGKRRSIPSICIQESMIDFSTKKRMQRSDYAMLQGIYYLKYFEKVQAFITGNPRYKLVDPKEQNVKNVVLINCNFTYGIHENKRDHWLKSIVETLLKSNESNFAISKHPRDLGVIDESYPVLESGASKVSDQLKMTKVLITRFSSLIHEALFHEVPVIYFNPHNEHEQNNFEIDNRVIQLATNKVELESAIGRIQNEHYVSSDFHDYINRNCLDLTGSPPADIISNILNHIKFKPSKATLLDILQLPYQSPFIRKLSLNFRDFMNKWD